MSKGDKGELKRLDDPEGELPTDDESEQDGQEEDMEEDEVVDYEADEEEDDDHQQDDHDRHEPKKDGNGDMEGNVRMSGEKEVEERQREERGEKSEKNESETKGSNGRGYTDIGTDPSLKVLSTTDTNNIHDKGYNDNNDKSDIGKKSTGYTRVKVNEVNAGNASYGVYIPPFKRRQMELETMDLASAASDTHTKQRSNSEEEEEEGQVSSNPNGPKSPPLDIQRQKWEDLKRSIHGTINRLNTSNIKPLIHALFQNANLIRGRGLLVKATLRAATTSPSFAHIYAALIAVLHTKLPEIGELVLTRAILAFRKSFARKDRAQTYSLLNFIGHLFNQGLCHELLCLQILTLLLDDSQSHSFTVTDDAVELAVQFMYVIGMAMLQCSPAGVHAIFERFRSLLHQGNLDKRVQYKIEEIIKERSKFAFANHPTLIEQLDLVEKEEQIVVELSLDEEGLVKEEQLDFFHYDPDWGIHEQTWLDIRKEILGEDDDSDSDDNSDNDDNSDSDDNDSDDNDTDNDSDEDGELPTEQFTNQTSTSLAPNNNNNNNKQLTVIHDLSEKDLIHLRRTIYLTIMSSATFEECTHKLTKIDIPPGKEMELINMIIECCSQERTFLRYYGLISGRFCLLHERWQHAFGQSFVQQYQTIHRLETNKLRNVAKLFAHLLHTDSLSWQCLSAIHLNEDETTSSSRIFIKIVVQEMAEAKGIATLVQRFHAGTDTDMNTNTKTSTNTHTFQNNHQNNTNHETEWYAGMFPKDNPRNTRYAINFFTSIGLGPLTDGLREHLKNAPKLILMQAQAEAAAAKAKKDDDDDSSSSSVSSSSVSSSSVSSTSSSSTGSRSYSSRSYSSRSGYTSSSSYTSYSSSDQSELSNRGRRHKRERGRGRERNSDRRSRESPRDRDVDRDHDRDRDVDRDHDRERDVDRDHDRERDVDRDRPSRGSRRSTTSNTRDKRGRNSRYDERRGKGRRSSRSSSLSSSDSLQTRSDGSEYSSSSSRRERGRERRKVRSSRSISKSKLNRSTHSDKRRNETNIKLKETKEKENGDIDERDKADEVKEQRSKGKKRQRSASYSSH